MIDKNIKVSDLIGTIKEFSRECIMTRILNCAFGRIFSVCGTAWRLIFPAFLQSKGCSVCKHSGWLESAGSGMIHPQVLKNMGVDSKIYSGFAFGFGIDRMVMVYYGIDDIRLLYNGDLRFIKQFSMKLLFLGFRILHILKNIRGKNRGWFDFVRKRSGAY